MNIKYQKRRYLRMLTRFIREYEADTPWHQDVVNSLKIEVAENDPHVFRILLFTFLAGPTNSFRDHRYIYAHIYIDLTIMYMLHYERTRVFALQMEAEKTLEELLRVVDRDIAKGNAVPTISVCMKQDIKYLGTYRIGGKK